MATPEETTPETIDQTRTRAVKIIQILQKTYPQAKCALLFGDVHQLLVATILSAQCTDERVNLTTPLLFEKYQNIEAFASADVKELEKEVFSTGFYVNKAKAIKESAKQIIEKFGGEIPKSIAELTTLAGVGRKTASVVLGVGYGIAEGIVVDTHVGRISRLLGFTRKNDPAKIEKI
ncbi:MAG: endonuclease III [candidate division Zixibacteria bacterium]|nr:endonuclease III [candidate division Zixibacteria bacterium]